MSLFSSSFEGASTAGPSFQSKNTGGTGGGGKRKRPSLGDGKDGQIRSTTANLQKLMKKVESGDGSTASPRVKSSAGKAKIPKRGNGEGGEAIGVISKKKARKSFGDEEDDTPRKHFKDTSGNKEKSKKNDDSPAGKKIKASNMKAKDNDDTPQKPKKSASSSSSKIEPAELQLPHTIRPDHDDSAGNEGLTKMQKDMKAKLEGARFRWINEQLYSTPSTEAVEMMQKDPKIFSDYHLTHRALTSAWPQPPLPHLISLLTPLPASTVIADLGCGDAGLAKALVPQGKIVLSYDLVGDRGMVGGGKGEGWVVEADFLTSVPLPGRTGLGNRVDGVDKSGKRRKGKGREEASEIVDVVVCCLSLMGTNWIGGIYEACRILKPGGTLHIAEVTSRFVSTESFTSAIQSFGFELNDESSPSTHFTLFEFTKSSTVPIGPVKGEAGWEKRVREGGEILRACVYKKR